MRIQILGACGKFMSGLALMAKQLGHEVSGIDKNIHSELAQQLLDAGIPLQEGYDAHLLDTQAECVVVGNVMSRGYPIVEALLDSGLPYTSGPQWLAEHVLASRWVVAVSGTHGKTTTSSMVAWILESAGLNPGFLIGGEPHNFDNTARLTDSQFFVIEADEYDSAFFDKRPKFMHYRPKTLIANNIEFDHADIYDNLEAIKKQFHYLFRTIPSHGQIVLNARDTNCADVLAKGCWSEVVRFGGQQGDWQAHEIAADGSQFSVYHHDKLIGKVKWTLIGQHNVDNALAAIAAAVHVGVDPQQAVSALDTFKGVARRMHFRGEVSGVKIYDDFAHHPTAIKTTLAGVRASLGSTRLFTVVDFGSYTMRTGHHQNTLSSVFTDVDGAFFLAPSTVEWDVAALADAVECPATVCENLPILAAAVREQVNAGDVILVLSNQDSAAIVRALGV
jgi:UDP-N-acetylmuramate: L-alanyl-gamma-D-glutamyl-meso-diaminopimelate ligase